MPLIYVTMQKGKSAEYRDAIRSSIQQAMIDEFGVPLDDYSQVTMQVDPEDMKFDPNFFGLARSSDTIFVDLRFNKRPPEPKIRLCEAIADNLTASPGLRHADIMIVIKEVAPANWWVHGRTVDPVTGTDSRMSATA